MQLLNAVRKRRYLAKSLKMNDRVECFYANRQISIGGSAVVIVVVAENKHEMCRKRAARLPEITNSPTESQMGNALLCQISQ